MRSYAACSRAAAASRASRTQSQAYPSRRRRAPIECRNVSSSSAIRIRAASDMMRLLPFRSDARGGYRRMGRQDHGEGRAATDSRLHFDPSPHGLDEASRNREAEAHASLGAPHLGGKERVEDVRYHLSRNALSAIRYRDRHEFLIMRDRETDFAGRPGCLDRVPEEVAQDLDEIALGQP